MKSRDLLVHVAAGAIAGGVIAWTSMRFAQKSPAPYTAELLGCWVEALE